MKELYRFPRNKPIQSGSLNFTPLQQTDTGDAIKRLESLHPIVPLAILY